MSDRGSDFDQKKKLREEVGKSTVILHDEEDLDAAINEGKVLPGMGSLSDRIRRVKEKKASEGRQKTDTQIELNNELLKGIGERVRKSGVGE